MAEVLKKVNRTDIVECPSFKNATGWKQMTPDDFKLSVKFRRKDFSIPLPKYSDAKLNYNHSSSHISTY